MKHTNARMRATGLIAVALSLCAGCQSTSWDSLSWDNLTRPRVELPPPQSETIFRAGHWEQETSLQPGTLAGDFSSAKVLFERGAHHDAERVFAWLGKRAEKEKNIEMHEECMFWEAESLYAQKKYPDARDTYARLLTTYPSSRYRNEAVQRQFTIADYWLNDTRDEMKTWEGSAEDKRWFIWPSWATVSFAKDKPTFDGEGHAIKACEAVFTQDPAGSLAPQALYRAGGVSYFREHYGESDNYYSILVEQFPKSPLAPHALELAIQSKINSVKGPDYDARKLAEARQLVDTGLRSYPELKDKKDYLENTLVRINEAQAQKDFNIAEFYRRTKHHGAAYFYYEIVRRRYPGTKWAEQATERMHEVRTEVESE